MRRCLERKPKRRLGNVGEALSHLEEALAPVDEAPSVVLSVPPVVQPAGWRQALPLALGISAVAVVLTGLTAWSLMRSGGTTSLPIRRFAIDLGPARPISVANVHAMPVWSPGGTRLVYAADLTGAPQLYMRALDELEAQPIAGTEGAYEPFFSPDGE